MNPDITSYDVSVNGLGAHIIPAESVCMEPSPEGPDSQMSCSYSYPVPRDQQNFMVNSMNRNTLQVAAVNEIGRGRTCSPNIGKISIIIIIDYCACPNLPKHSTLFILDSSCNKFMESKSCLRQSGNVYSYSYSLTKLI